MFKVLKGKSMPDPKQNTKFRLVMPSAQTDTPMLDRGVRLFLEDGTEIFGLLSIQVSDTATGGRISLAFEKDAFTVEQ